MGTNGERFWEKLTFDLFRVQFLVQSFVRSPIPGTNEQSLYGVHFRRVLRLTAMVAIFSPILQKLSGWPLLRRPNGTSGRRAQILLAMAVAGEGELVLSDVRSPGCKSGSWMNGVESEEGPYSYTTEVSPLVSVTVARGSQSISVGANGRIDVGSAGPFPLPSSLSAWAVSSMGGFAELVRSLRRCLSTWETRRGARVSVAPVCTNPKKSSMQSIRAVGGGQ